MIKPKILTVLKDNIYVDLIFFTFEAAGTIELGLSISHKMCLVFQTAIWDGSYFLSENLYIDA